MITDPETGNYIGKGEIATFNILKYITHLPYRSLKHFPFSDGIYKQVPIQWIISQGEYERLSPELQGGSIDLFIVANKRRISIRVQGKGHGEKLKGIGKARSDKIQKLFLKKYCEVVDIELRECKQVFKDNVNELAIKEIISSFMTANVEIPIL